MKTINTMEVQQEDFVAKQRSGRILAYQLGERYALTSQQLEHVSGAYSVPQCYNTCDPDGYCHRDCGNPRL